MIVPSTPATARDVAQHYNELDPFYRKLWGEHLHHGLWKTGKETNEEATRQMIDLAASALPLGPETHLCDIGCGYGGTSRYLVNSTGARTTGVTLSDNQAKHAASLSNGDNPKILVRNWLENGFDDSSFDAMISIECLAHVENKNQYFSEVFRTLRPGGRLSLTAWLEGDTATKSQRESLLKPICYEGRLPAMGTASDYIRIAEEEGLRLVSHEDITTGVIKTWTICCRRLPFFMLTQPAAWKYLLNWKERTEAIFIPTLWRILRAYRIGAMSYGWFVFEKPES